MGVTTASVPTSGVGFVDGGGGGELHGLRTAMRTSRSHSAQIFPSENPPQPLPFGQNASV